MRSSSAKKTSPNLAPKSERSARPRPEAAEAGQSIGLELRRTDRAVEGDLQARLASIGLQIGMWLYLRALWHEDGLTQSELSRRVRASKPTTLAQLRRMELRGLIRFERRSQDKRLVAVRLTPEGRVGLPELDNDLLEKVLPVMFGKAVQAAYLVEHAQVFVHQPDKGFLYGGVLQMDRF